MSNLGLTRREFLASSATGAAALGAGATLAGCSQSRPAATGGGKRTPHSFRLGLDTYMLHHALTAKNPRNRLDLWWVIDQLGDIGLTGLQIDPSHFKLVPGDDQKALDRLESMVKPKGYYVEFGMGGWDPTRMAERIKLTARFGGRALRTFCGHEGSTQEEIANYIKWSAPAFRETAKVAEDNDVYIAIENHGDFTSAQLKQLLDMVSHPRVGACLDTGNSLFRKEDPLQCAKVLAPYATSMHLKDWFMRFTPEGKPDWKEAPLGQGEVPIAEILRIVAKHHPDLYIALESPPRPGKDEAETSKREWEHLVATARDARRILAEL